MDYRQIDLKLQGEFARKRIKAEKQANVNLAKANACPTFFELSKLEKEIMLEIAKQKTQNNNKNGEIKAFEDTLALARRNKLEILKKLGLTEDDLKPKFECEKCSDVGFIGSTMCDCYKKRRNEELIKASGFDASKLPTLSEYKTDEILNASQKTALEKIKDKLLSWANKYPNIQKNVIMISGQTGVGKTFLVKSLAGEMFKKNANVCFVSSLEMNEMFLKYHTTFDSNKQAQIAPLIESEILFVDDLGTETILNNVTLNYLYLILSERDRFNRPTIFTSNLLADGLLSKYGERIYSRLFNKRTSFCVNLSGEDLRLK